MNGPFLVRSALSLTLCLLPFGAAGAQSPDGSPPQSHDRGIYAEEVGGQVAAPVVKVAPPVKGPSAVKTQPKSSTATSKAGSRTIVPAANSSKNSGDTTAGATQITLPGNHSLVPVAQSTTDSVVLTARLNKTGPTPRYKVGERMEINITASSDCNLVVLDFDSQGNLTQIYPNQFQPEGLAHAGSPIVIGGADSPFDYQVSGKGGEEKIFVYAYPVGASNPLTVAMLPAEHSPFRSASLSLEQYRDLVNNSKVFFARGVEVVAKSGAKPVSAVPSVPNKIELSYTVVPN